MLDFLGEGDAAERIRAACDRRRVPAAPPTSVTSEWQATSPARRAHD